MEERSLIVGVPAEVAPGERRVAATPASVEKLVGMGFDVVVEHGAGTKADFPDRLYSDSGAALVDKATVWSTSDIVIKVNPPNDDELQSLRPEATLVSLVRPAQNPELLQKLADRGATSIALDCVPRISRAQKMDVLSSMANIAGYRAVVEAAHAFGGFFTGQITAAGKTPPARVLVIGAGVAGLAAIGAARGLGAEVRAFDVRESVEDQVKSLGGKFLKVQIEESGEGIGGYAKVMSPEYIAAEMELFANQAREVDIIITTALIPGQRAPTLITKEMVQSMRPGSVVVDLAAEAGGNCELTRTGEKISVSDVTVIGYTDLTSRMPKHASTFFAQNLAYLLEEMGGAKDFRIDTTNDAVRGALVVHHGEVTWPPPPLEHPAPKSPAKRGEQTGMPAAVSKPSRGMHTTVGTLVGAALIAAVGTFAPQDFLAHFTVFILAIFVGWQVVWNVTPALHTPLMSVTNAISGIIIVGGLLQAGTGSSSDLAAALAAVAVLVASINIAGGFLVTQRMLGMFRKEGGRP